MILFLVLFFTALCAATILLWLKAQKRKFVERPYKCIFDLTQKPGSFLTFQNRSDLTGAFAQLAVLVAGLATRGGRGLLAPGLGKDYSLNSFESQGISYEKVSSFMDREDHIANNAACMDQLGLTEVCVRSLPGNIVMIDLENWKSVMLVPLLRRPLLIDLGGRTGNVIKMINRGAGGIDNVFSDAVRSRLNAAYNRRNDLQVRIPGKKGRPIVCIHARHGEICDMPRRFIPSSEYKNLLTDLQESMPDAEIHLYSTRWCDGDDPAVFLKHGVQMHVDDAGVFETWRRFIEADVLVTAVSSFSTVPALLRCNGIVVYRESHCPPLRDWFHWDGRGILGKEGFRQRCHDLFAFDAVSG